MLSALTVAVAVATVWLLVMEPPVGDSVDMVAVTLDVVDVIADPEGI